MRKIVLVVFAIGFSVGIACKDQNRKEVVPTAQSIVDKAIQVSGGSLYKSSSFSFDFRDKSYSSEIIEGKRILKRMFNKDSVFVEDVKTNANFERFVDGKVVQLPDSLSNSYANSVNSVHYFAYLPFGLNDQAVKKEYLGVIDLKGTIYDKIKVTFSQENGGDDFDDIYIYWFNQKTGEPDYLAYEFHVNDGGLRFREAYNKRFVKGVRFVDYNNYKPKTNSSSIYHIDSLFLNDKLELLSKIELIDIKVNPGNYN